MNTRCQQRGLQSSAWHHYWIHYWQWPLLKTALTKDWLCYNLKTLASITKSLNGVSPIWLPPHKSLEGRMFLDWDAAPLHCWASLQWQWDFRPDVCRCEVIVGWVRVMGNESLLDIGLCLQQHLLRVKQDFSQPASCLVWHDGWNGTERKTWNWSKWAFLVYWHGLFKQTTPHNFLDDVFVWIRFFWNYYVIKINCNLLL